MQDSTNLQALNRYSYVLNNPLSYTDPSGYFFSSLKKFVSKAWKAVKGAHSAVFEFERNLRRKILRKIGENQIISVAVSTVIGIYCIPCVMAFNAAMVDANGGTIAQMLTGAAIGAVTSGIPVGEGFLQGGLTGQLAGILGNNAAANVGASLIMGGALAKAQGGKFIDGVKGAAVGAAISYGIHRIMNPEPTNSGFSTDEDGERYFLDSDGNRAYPDRFLNEDGNPLLAMNLEERILLDKAFYGDEQAGIMACSPYIDCMKAVEAGYGPDIIDNPNWEAIVDKSNSILRKSWKFLRNPAAGFGISVGEKVNANQVCTEYAKNSGVTCY